MRSSNEGGNEVGAPDPQVQVKASGAVGVASAPADKSREASLFEEWGEFLEKLKDSRDLPIVALVKALKFYRDHVDANIFIDFAPLDRRIFAYKIGDRFGWIRFYTVDGLEISFEWLYDLNTLAVYFDHLARTEVYEG